MTTQANKRPRPAPVDLPQERLERAVEALEDAEKSLTYTQEQLREFEINQVHLRAAYDTLRQVERSLWNAKRLLGGADVDRFVLYEIQDILTNPSSQAGLPSILAALRTATRLAERPDDATRERVESDTEKVLLPGIGQVLGRIQDAKRRIS